MFYLRKIIIFLIIFLIGGLGGVFGERILFPYLAGKPWFSNIKFIKEAVRGTTIINTYPQKIIRENNVLEEAAQRISSSVVVVRSLNKKGTVLNEGSGFVLTNDGLILTANDILLKEAAQYEAVINNKKSPAEIRLKDSRNGIAILKVEEPNLPMVSFEEPGNIKAGEAVFLLAKKIEGEDTSVFLNNGIARAKDDDEVLTNIFSEDLAANGSPLMNIEGKVVGVNLVDSKGNLTTVFVTKIRDLLNIALR